MSKDAYKNEARRAIPPSPSPPSDHLQLCRDLPSVGFSSTQLLGCGFKILVPFTPPLHVKIHLPLLL